MSQRLERRVLTILCAASILQMLLQPIRALRDFVQTDFLASLTGAQLLRQGGCLYCAATQHSMEQSLAVTNLPSGQQNAFLDPPFTALLLRPFTYLDPKWALESFIAVSLFALLLIGWWLIRNLLPDTLGSFDRTVMAILICCSGPAAWGLARGQWDAVILLGIVGALVLTPSRPFIAGIALSSIAIKPQVAFLVPVALLMGRHWRVIAGFLCSTVALAAVSLLLLGVSHISDWIQLTEHQDYAETIRTLALPGLVGWIAGTSAAAFVASCLLILGAAALLWRWREKLRDPTTAIAIGVALTFLATPHAWTYDLLLLGIPVAAWASAQPRAALGALLAVTITSYIDLALPNPYARVETAAILLVAIGLIRARVLTPALIT